MINAFKQEQISFWYLQWYMCICRFYWLQIFFNDNDWNDIYCHNMV